VIETVVAENFEALVARGIAYSRMKDFYNLYLIAKTFQLPPEMLVEAISRTFERRRTALPERVPVGLTANFAAAWQSQWRAFVTRERMAAVPDDLAQA
jgi:Nucleotidyl transferase AbiEii toxin, Type IV TA system